LDRFAQISTPTIHSPTDRASAARCNAGRTQTGIVPAAAALPKVFAGVVNQLAG
jgi:hypothetical protein